MNKPTKLELERIFKKNVKKVLKDKGMSVAELCKALGQDRYYLAQLKVIRLNVIVDVATALECKASILVEGM